jgi:hypothetical protein
VCVCVCRSVCPVSQAKARASVCHLVTQARHRTLWYARDVTGRRSLLVCQPNAADPIAACACTPEALCTTCVKCDSDGQRPTRCCPCASSLAFGLASVVPPACAGCCHATPLAVLQVRSCVLIAGHVLSHACAGCDSPPPHPPTHPPTHLPHTLSLLRPVPPPRVRSSMGGVATPWCVPCEDHRGRGMRRPRTLRTVTCVCVCPRAYPVACRLEWPWYGA